MLELKKAIIVEEIFSRPDISAYWAWLMVPKKSASPLTG
jgi:hypothetical protein